MKSLLSAMLTFGCLGYSVSAMAAAFDFTPRQYDFTVDGVLLRDVSFSKGPQTILYHPPANWTISGRGQAASLRTASADSVRAEMAYQDDLSPAPFDEEGMKRLRERSRTLVPDARNLELTGELRNPLLIGGRETIQFFYTGVLFAQKYKFAVILLPLESEQFSFVLYANEKEFDEAYKQFLSSLFSWRNRG